MSKVNQMNYIIRRYWNILWFKIIDRYTFASNKPWSFMYINIFYFIYLYVTVTRNKKKTLENYSTIR